MLTLAQKWTLATMFTLAQKWTLVTMFTLAQKWTLATMKTRGETDQQPGYAHLYVHTGELNAFSNRKKPSFTQPEPELGQSFWKTDKTLSMWLSTDCPRKHLTNREPANKPRCVPARESGHKTEPFTQQREHHTICCLEGTNAKELSVVRHPLHSPEQLQAKQNGSLDVKKKER
jgi:hypothetical protein